MRPSARFIPALAALLLAALACSLPPASPAPTLSPEDAAASVAATLTAIASGGSPETGITPPAEGGPTLTPTLPPPPPVLRVAYIKNNNLFLWTDGIGSVALTFDGTAQGALLSSDGQVVAFLRESVAFHPEIWAINTDGSNERLLVSAAELSATYVGSAAEAPAGIGIYRMAWRPGSHSLYYSTRPLYEGPGYMGYYDLHSVDADAFVKATLFTRDTGGVPFFSPNGMQIALSTPTSISLVNFDGSNLRPDVLVYGNVITYSEYLYHPSPVWAPDSSALRVAIPPADPLLEPLNPTALWYIPTDGSPAVFTGGILAIPFAWPDTAISPDLARVAYAMPVGIPTDNMRELHIANSDGSGDTIYATGESLQFTGWLPNSTQFVFEVNGSGPLAGAHVGTVGGAYTTLSVDASLMTDISWPDATHFLCRWRSGPNWELRYNLLGGVGSALIDSGNLWEYDFSY